MAAPRKSRTLPNPFSQKANVEDNYISKEEGSIPTETPKDINCDFSPTGTEGVVDQVDNLEKDLNDIEYRRKTWDCRQNASNRSNPLRWTTGSVKSEDASLTQDLFLLYVPDNSCKQIQMLIKELQSNKILDYLDFEQDFLPNESLFNIIGSCLMQSKRTVLFLSPLFYASTLHMYLLETTVAYYADHERNGVISLLVDTTKSERPKSLSPFSCIDTRNDSWLRDLINEAQKTVQPLKADVCLNESHFSMDNFLTLRSVYSEPATLKRHHIPDSIKMRLKIWSKIFKRRILRPEECSKPVQDKPRERGVDSKVSFACELRRNKKRVYECSKIFINDSLNLAAGDVVEIISKIEEDSTKVNVCDCNGHKGEIPTNYLTPSVFAIPWAAVDLLNQPISKKNNDEFKLALEEMGQPVFMATKTVRGNSKELQVNEKDILSMISDTGNRYEMKNYHNKVGYINKSSVIELKPTNVSNV